jgi:hypothetical protein
MDDKVILINEKETAFHKIITKKTEHDCYCHGAFISQREPELRNKITHENCPCQEKLDKFTDKTELNCFAAEREFLKQENFGPCIPCKGTGRHVRTVTIKRTKYLCVNGPQEGDRFTTDDMSKANPNYVLYNSNGRTDPQFKCVWVWEKAFEMFDPGPDYNITTETLNELKAISERLDNDNNQK